MRSLRDFADRVTKGIELDSLREHLGVSDEFGVGIGPSPKPHPTRGAKRARERIGLVRVFRGSLPSRHFLVELTPDGLKPRLPPRFVLTRLLVLGLLRSPRLLVSGRLPGSLPTSCFDSFGLAACSFLALRVGTRGFLARGRLLLRIPLRRGSSSSFLALGFRTSGFLALRLGACRFLARCCLLLCFAFGRGLSCGFLPL